MAYVTPAGMGALNPMMAQDWISTHLWPSEAQMKHLLKNSSSLSSRSPAFRGSSMLLDYPGILS